MIQCDMCGQMVMHDDAYQADGVVVCEDCEDAWDDNCGPRFTLSDAGLGEVMHAALVRDGALELQESIGEGQP